MKPKKNKKSGKAVGTGSAKAKAVSVPMEDPFETILADVSKAAAARVQRRKTFTAKTPKPQKCIVAWIDMLGFKEELGEAKTKAAFKKVYDKVRQVHEEFGKVSACPDPENQDCLNKSYGRSVISLSDGLVVVQSMEAPVLKAGEIEPFDFVHAFIEDLTMAQAQCVFRGIFLRGGIAVGKFWFEDDILLSPAHVKAYLIESKVALNPAILIERKEIKKFVRMQGKWPSDTGLEQYRDCEWLTGNKYRKYMMLDYVRIMMSGEHGWASESNRLACNDKSKSGEERQRIMDESWDRQFGNVLRSFKARLIAAYQMAPNEKVRNKYRWLMRYFNGYFERTHPLLAGAAISETDGVWLEDVPLSCREKTLNSSSAKIS